MAVYYVKSGAGATEFAQSTAYTLGQKIVPKRSDTGTNHLVGKRYVWECTTAGTSTNAEPTWASSVTADTTTFTSGTAVFTARKPGFSSGTTANWAFATIYLDYVGALAVTGDTVYVSNNHAESLGTSAFGGGTNTVNIVTAVQYVCVDDSATPPTTLATTATVTTGAANLTVGTASSYVYGVTFTCGSGDTASRTLTSAGIFESCNFAVATTGTGIISCGQARWINCGVKFGSAASNMQPTQTFFWSGGSLLSGGTSPTALFSTSIAATVENINLTNANAAISLVNNNQSGHSMVFRNCKLPASWSGSVNSATLTGVGITTVTSSDNTGTNYIYRKKTNGGETFSETTIVRSGGASDGTTALSHKLVSNSAAAFPQITCSTPDIIKWIDSTGSSKTITVELVTDNVTLTNGECWIEASYYSESGSPLGATVTSAKAGVLASATNLTSSSETWTTTGLSTPVKQKISVTFTPQLKGFVTARVILARASTTVYVDPKLAVT